MLYFLHLTQIYLNIISRKILIFQNKDDIVNCYSRLICQEFEQIELLFFVLFLRMSFGDVGLCKCCLGN
jgi:hypothetical protein